MKIIYDRETDTLTIILTDTPVAESEDKPGVILDYDATGNLVSRRFLTRTPRTAPSKIEYRCAPSCIGQR